MRRSVSTWRMATLEAAGADVWCPSGSSQAAESRARASSAVFVTVCSRLPLGSRPQVVAGQRQCRATLGLERAQRVAAAHSQRLAEQRAHRRALERAVLPRQIDLEAAARSQAG